MFSITRRSFPVPNVRVIRRMRACAPPQTSHRTTAFAPVLDLATRVSGAYGAYTVMITILPVAPSFATSSISAPAAVAHLLFRMGGDHVAVLEEYDLVRIYSRDRFRERRTVSIE